MNLMEELSNTCHDKYGKFCGGGKLSRLRLKTSSKARGSVESKIKSAALSTAVGTRLRATKVSRGVATEIVKVQGGTAYSRSGRAFKPTGRIAQPSTGSIGEMYVWKDSKGGREMYSPTSRPQL